MNNELTTIDNKVSLVDVRLHPETYPRICNLPLEQVVMQMTVLVTKAFMYRGQQADEENIKFISASLVDELLMDDIYGAKFLTMHEISFIIKRAVLESEMFGVTVASLYKVISQYCKGEGRNNDLKAKMIVQAKRRSDLMESPISTMIQSYAGQLTRN